MFQPKNKLSAWGKGSGALSPFIDNKVIVWLNERTKLFLCDYVNIKYISGTYMMDGIWDYSFLIMPAFKALEGTMLQIGESLGFDSDKYKHKVGGMFNQDKLDEFYEDVLNKIESISEESKADIKQWLDNARRILRSLRHNPAHYNGEVKPFEKAFLDGDLILSTINYMCIALLESGVFEKIPTNI